MSTHLEDSAIGPQTSGDDCKQASLQSTKASPKYVPQNVEVWGMAKISSWKEHGNCGHIEPRISSKWTTIKVRINGRGNQYAQVLTNCLQNQTAKVIALQELSSTISNDWPENRNSIPAIIGPYYDKRDELTIQNGVIFKGDRAVVPQALCKDMLKSIHSSHLGVMPSTSQRVGIVATNERWGQRVHTKCSAM